MNVISLFLFFFSCVFAKIEEGDSQIFDMQHELSGLFGPKANFYSVLEIDKTADEKEIKKAYNRISLKWFVSLFSSSFLILYIRLYLFYRHPDKNPSKDAEPFYKIVTSIQEILRNPKKRTRYDTYLTRGFPVWRGNNYYSAIWEPSTFTVALFLLIIISAAQYATLTIYYFQDIQKVKEAKKEMDEKIASKTPAQIVKELKKAGSDTHLSKKDLKKAGSDPNISKEILIAAGLLNVPTDPVFPSVHDLVIVTFPRWIFQSVSGFFVKNDNETCKSK